MKIGLVLEGGGLRGMYTIGALDALMEENINFNYVVGVSAGACNGISYVSGQKGRNYRVNMKYVSDKRYLSVNNFIKTKSLFGMGFIFDYIPDHLDILDKNAVMKNPCEFEVGATNVITGKCEFFSKEEIIKNNDIIKASSSIPLFSPKIKINGNYYLDGGTSCPIPIKRAFLQKCDKVVVILTRERSYVKPPEKFRSIYKRAFSNYPKMIETLDNRHIVYNKTLNFIKECEKNGSALVLAPSSPPEVGRFEKDQNKLEALFKAGYTQTTEKIEKIKEFVL